MLVPSLTLKALINKLCLILYINNIFAALGLHTTKCHCNAFIVVILCCMAWKHTVLWMKPFVAFHLLCCFTFSFLLPLRLSDSSSSTLLCCISALSHIHFCSSFLHLVDDCLVFEWCVFCSMICSVVSLLLPGLFLFLLFLLHPGSPPTLTYVSASDVLNYNRTMLMTMLYSSPTVLVTP